MSLAGLTARKGAPVSCTKAIPGTYDAATDTSTPPTTLTVDGYAIQVDGDPDLYTALGLIESENPTLQFTPKIRGVIPVLGMAVPWGSETFTVKNIKPLAMAGVATAARLVVGR
jgi:hypothetical protein